MYNDVAEINEENNTAFLKFIIGIASEGVDLTFSDIQYEIVNDTLDITLTVFNQGNEDLYNYFSCSLVYSNDSLLDDYDYPLEFFTAENLKARATLTQHFHTELSEIYYYKYLLLVVDPYDSIPESDELNNWRSIDLPGTNVTDLEVHIPYQVGQVHAGEDFVQPVEIYNVGLAPSLEYGLYFYLSQDEIADDDDMLIFADTLASIPGGEKLTLLQDMTMPQEVDPGKYYIMVRIEHLFDLDAGNNTGYVPYYVLEPEPVDKVYDLEVKVPFGIFTAFVGDSIALNYTLENLHDSISDTIIVAYYLSEDAEISEEDILLGKRLLLSMSQGESIEITDTLFLPDSLSAGNYALIISAVTEGELSENDLDNNSAFIYYELKITGIIDSGRQGSWCTLYPNPARDRLYLRSEIKLESFRILDNTGRVLHHALIDDWNETTIDVKKLTPGIYYLVISAGDKIETKLFEVVR